MTEHLMWAVTAASLVGTVANVYRRRWCFYVWSCTNALWVAYDLHHRIYPQAALMACLLAMALWGLVKWRKPRGEGS